MSSWGYEKPNGPLVQEGDDEGLKQGCTAIAMRIGKGRFEKHSGDRIDGAQWMMDDRSRG